MIGYPLDSHVEFDENNVPVFDRAVTSAPLRKLIKKLFSDGIMPNVSTNMQVSATTEMKVTVNRGFAICGGCLKLEEEKTTLTLDAADSNYERIDRIVLRLDDSVAARSCEFAVVKGTPSANPVLTSLVRDETVWEIGLADIRVSANTSIISNKNITDTRYDSSVCGVISLLGELDSEGIYQQVQADLAEFKAGEQKEFTDWFKKMKNQLSTDAAGELQKQIEVERERINELASLEEGSTTGDAELQDIRAGADGKRYSTAGEAVRTQFWNNGYARKRLETLTDLMVGENVVLMDDSDALKAYDLASGGIEELKVGDLWEGIDTYKSYPFAKTIHYKHLPGGKVIDFSGSCMFESDTNSMDFGPMYVVNSDDIVADIVSFDDLKNIRLYYVSEDCTIYFSRSNIFIGDNTQVYRILEVPDTEKLQNAINQIDLVRNVYGSSVIRTNQYLSCDNQRLYPGDEWDGVDNYVCVDKTKNCAVWVIHASANEVIDFRGGIFPKGLSDSLYSRLYVIAYDDITHIFDIVDFGTLKKNGTYRCQKDCVICYTTRVNYSDTDKVYSVRVSILDALAALEDKKVSSSELINDAGFITQQDFDGIAQYYVSDISSVLTGEQIITDSVLEDTIGIGDTWDGAEEYKIERKGYRVWSANALSSQIIDFAESVLKDVVLYVITDNVVQDIVRYDNFRKTKTYKFTTASSKFAITALTDSGQVAYVNFGTYNQAQKPNQSTCGKVSLENGSAVGTFRLKDADTGKYLHFHKASSKLYFDRCSNPCGESDDFELFRRSEGEYTSPIKGYEKVSSLAEIVTGEKFLIAALGDDENYYVMHPILGGANYNHVAKVYTVGNESKGRLGTALSVFEGKYIDLEKCLYTFDCDNVICVTGYCNDEDGLAFKIQRLDEFTDLKSNLDKVINELEELQFVSKINLFTGLPLNIDPESETTYKIRAEDYQEIITDACSDTGIAVEELFKKFRVVLYLGDTDTTQQKLVFAHEEYIGAEGNAICVPAVFPGDGIRIGVVKFDGSEFEILIPDGCKADTYYATAYLEKL